MERLKKSKTLGRYYLLDATLGQLHVEAGKKAREAFLAAREKTTSDKERELLDRKLSAL